MDNKEKQKKVINRSIAKVKDYKQVFSTQAGKRVLADMMSSHYMFTATFAPQDPHMTSIREGERNVILRLLSILKKDPEKLRDYIMEEHDEYTR